MAATATEPMPQASTPTPMDRLIALVGPDMRRVDRLIHDRIESGVPLIPQLAAHLIDAGGKRLRPVLTLAAAQLCGYGGEDHIRLAAAVEFIHTATLLHDDVVDRSDRRRGRPTANILFGDKPSVLVGDFLFARAFQLMVETGSVAVLGILSDASAVIAEGEVMQLSTARNLDTTEAQHLAVIRAKTAALFAAATEVGAVVSGHGEAAQGALKLYGDRLGIAFQLADDALDYAGAAATLGKNPGDDFRDGKVTAPVMIAHAAGDEAERAFWQRTIGRGRIEDGDLDHALSLVARHDAVEATLVMADGYASAAVEALSIFPASPIREALEGAARFAVRRRV